MRISLFLTAMACGLTSDALAASQVIVHYPHTAAAAVVKDAERLLQLTTSPALAQRSWWPGTVIAEPLASAAAQQHYRQTLARLRGWAASEQGDRAAAVNAVIQQLSKVRVTGRQFTVLDPDWIRLHPEANRRLEGEYHLYTLRRPDTVTLMGAISNDGKTSWRPGGDTRDYLQGHTRLSGAEMNQAIVIAPDGATQTVPVAYWNHRHVEVMPGSTIFIGFSRPALPDELRDLNSQIVTILTQRVPD
ncbi:hypothetical protein FKM52_16515 [Mixta tenebrionis]|uniref:Uncharacterized protein n=2 Tax=Mixta tenebrionis TaxID=2562439 RepID=A0A506V4I8_9GAMM|nr:capsule biosynthesis GfcC family protein [Mixta tenebrionis]TPW40791.1 hypothetical protein FKM52_16515 [Mixta tenebrionis]